MQINVQCKTLIDINCISTVISPVWVHIWHSIINPHADVLSHLCTFSPVCNSFFVIQINVPCKCSLTKIAFVQCFFYSVDFNIAFHIKCTCNGSMQCQGFSSKHTAQNEMESTARWCEKTLWMTYPALRTTVLLLAKDA